MTDQSDRQNGDGLPDEHEHVLGFVSDASVAIHDEPMVVWVDSEGEWWGGLPQSFIKLSEHGWTVDRWQPLPTRDAAEGPGELKSRLEYDGWKQASVVSGYWIKDKPDHKFVNVCNGDLRKLEEATHDLATPHPAPDAMREYVTRLQEIGDWLAAKGNVHDASALYSIARALSAPVPSPDGANEHFTELVLKRIANLDLPKSTDVMRDSLDLAEQELRFILRMLNNDQPGKALEAARCSHDRICKTLLPPSATGAAEPVVTEDDGSGEPLPDGWKPPSEAHDIRTRIDGGNNPGADSSLLDGTNLSAGLKSVRGDREAIAETLWRAEYRRATGKERNVDWTDGVSDADKDGYRYLADAVLPVQLGAGEREALDQLYESTIQHMIDQWTGDVLKRKFASSWHYGELWKNIRAAILSRQPPQSSRETK